MRLHLPSPNTVTRAALAVAFALLTALALVSFVLTQRAANDALTTRNKRIDSLQTKIDTLLTGQALNAQERGRLSAQIEVLSEQIKRLCAGRKDCEPNVPSSTTTTTTAPKSTAPQSPQSSANPSPGTTTPPTTTPAAPNTPSTTTTTAPCRKVSSQLPICIG